MPELDAQNQIVIYQPNETVRLEVRLENEVQTKEPPLQSIFCQNKFWDAKSLLIKFIRRAKKELIVIDAYPGVATFIRRAKKELIVIDAYPGVATLDMLAKRGRGVEIKFADLKSQIATSTIDVREAA